MSAQFTSKVSIFYDYKGRGFSETLWSSLPIDTLRVTSINAYLDLRLALADDDVKPVYARISDGNNPRRVQFADLATSGRAGALSGNGSAPDDAIDIRTLGQSNTTAHMFLHGFPAKFLKETTLTNLGSWTAAFNSWREYMKQASNGWRLRYSTGNTPDHRQFMSAITPILPRGYSFTIPASIGVAIGDFIAVGGAGNAAVGVRGRKVVQKVSVDGKNITVGGAAPVGTVADGVAYCTKLTFTQEAFKDLYPLALTERKTGKVFGQPAGRRPNTLSLRR